MSVWRCHTVVWWWLLDSQHLTMDSHPSFRHGSKFVHTRTGSDTHDYNRTLDQHQANVWPACATLVRHWPGVGKLIQLSCMTFGLLWELAGVQALMGWFFPDPHDECWRLCDSLGRCAGRSLHRIAKKRQIIRSCFYNHVFISGVVCVKFDWYLLYRVMLAVTNEHIQAYMGD